MLRADGLADQQLAPGAGAEELRLEYDRLQVGAVEQRQADVLQDDAGRVESLHRVPLQPGAGRLEHLRLRHNLQLVALQQVDEAIFGQIEEFLRANHFQEVLVDELTSQGFQFVACIHVGEIVDT